MSAGDGAPRAGDGPTARGSRTLVLLALAAIGAFALPILPRAWSFLAVERIAVRPSQNTLGYCTASRFTGRLHGPVEVWSASTGELVARGTFDDGFGVLRGELGPPSTVDVGEWTMRSISSAVQSLETLQITWSGVARPADPHSGARSVAPWVEAGISSEEWWERVGEE
jgi:hypothetical protein